MESQAMFLECPAYLDTDGATRCGLPAEVEARYTMRSADGPLESPRSGAYVVTGSMGPSSSSQCGRSQPRRRSTRPGSGHHPQEWAICT